MSNSIHSIHIDTSKISEIDRRLLAYSVIDDLGLEKYFEDPENQRRFKIWQEERKKKAETKKIAAANANG